jgi:hypothetical protein
MTKTTRLPGHHHRRFTVTTALPSGKTAKADDGMPLKEWSQAGDLLQRVTYVGDVDRMDGRWSLVVQWVDLDNVGHRIALPHEVVEKLFHHGDNIMAAARSDRAQAGAATRRANSGPTADAECSCEHYYDDHEFGSNCRAETMEGRARCSCPGFKAA